MKLPLLILGSLLATCAFGQSTSFHNTCTDIKLNDDGSGFTATCKKRDGSPVQAAFTFQGLQNIDGTLTFIGGAPTNYQQTCNTLRLQVPSKTMQLPAPRLTAQCKVKSGPTKATSINLGHIQNIDGRLTQ